MIDNTPLQIRRWNSPCLSTSRQKMRCKVRNVGKPYLSTQVTRKSFDGHSVEFWKWCWGCR
ncbi:hypothetical protein M378DRAFT_166907 [Amanita muscaria Koide BX008]|uniref:Uncharacterized protein n=1 Tax=Amanita muscaria (strain Koide BX008) TaxID=946122 RepID=A0A0C2WIU2_AMAMK|nr:hypothetical protein M378DRAFT_166907 [Amanita muscaria Koide BX008]